MSRLCNMSSNTGLGLQRLFPENLFRGIHELITKSNGLDWMIHRGSHNIPYGFMGLVTLTAGAFTYVTYHDYATEVSNELSDALDSVQSSELFIPADQDSLKDSMVGETENNKDGNDENENAKDNSALDNAEENNNEDEKLQSIEGEKEQEEVLEKETPKESDPEGSDPKNELKRVGQQDKENRKTENSPKVRSETDELTKTKEEGKKGGSSKKKTIKHRKLKK